MNGPGDTSESVADPRKRVLIIGGGLAGLAVAEGLAEQFPERFAIRLLEAKRTTGGRAGSFMDTTTGASVDYCQHVAMGCCTNFLGLMQRRGLSNQLHRYSQLQLYHPDFPVSTFGPSQWLPPPLHLMPALSALRYLSRTQRRQIRRGLFRLFRSRSEQLTGRIAEDWLREHGQNPDTIRDFWGVIVVSALGESIDRVSLAAVRKVFVDGFAAARGASDVLVPKLPLVELIGERLTAEIRGLGVEIVTGQRVRQIIDSGNAGSVVTAGGEIHHADHVVVAVPWHSLANLIPQGTVVEAERLTSLPSSPISGLHLWFDRQITDLPHAVMVGTVSQWIFRQPWGTEDSSKGFYYQVVISASQSARCLPRQQLIETVIGELQHAFPAAKEANLRQSKVVTDPQSIFSISPEFEAIRPPSQTQLSWLHLAGDWIATGWPATMEGAVISGRMAAANILEAESLGSLEVDSGLRWGWLARQLIQL